MTHDLTAEYLDQSWPYILSIYILSVNVLKWSKSADTTIALNIKFLSSRSKSKSKKTETIPNNLMARVITTIEI